MSVRLSAAGRELAGPGAALRIATVQMHYVFADDAAVEILRSEWPALRAECDPKGAPLFEEVQGSAASSADEEK